MPSGWKLPSLRRNVVELERAVQKAGGLGFYGEVQVARHCHEAAYDARGRDLHFVKILRLCSRQIRTEDPLQPLRRVAVEVGGGGRQRVGHDVQLAQRLAQLGDVQLQRRFHRIEEHGVRRPGDVCGGRAGVALLQKLRYGGAQHPLLRHKAVGLFPSQ